MKPIDPKVIFQMRLFRLQKVPIKVLAKELGVSPSTVKKYTDDLGVTSRKPAAPKPPPKPKATPLERFWSKVDRPPQGDDGAGDSGGPLARPCWNWTAGTTMGYGQILWGDKVRLAHRVSWMLHREGGIPEGYIVAHKCGNKLCVNPDHLECVSPSEHTRNLHARGLIQNPGRPRGATGEANGASKLTELDVSLIRSVYVKGSHTYGARPLARMFGVSKPTIVALLSGETWKHVAPEEATPSEEVSA